MTCGGSGSSLGEGDADGGGGGGGLGVVIGARLEVVVGDGLALGCGVLAVVDVGFGG